MMPKMFVAILEWVKVHAEWIKVLAPIVVSIAVVFVTISFNRWQRRLEREKLRHQLYERRLGVYQIFRELLLALPEPNEESIVALSRQASIALAELPFLFDPADRLRDFLNELCRRINNEVIYNIRWVRGMKESGILRMEQADPKTCREFAERVTDLGRAKIVIPDEYFERLLQEFAPFLRLTDLSK